MTYLYTRAYCPVCGLEFSAPATVRSDDELPDRIVIAVECCPDCHQWYRMEEFLLALNIEEVEVLA